MAVLIIITLLDIMWLRDGENDVKEGYVFSNDEYPSVAQIGISVIIILAWVVYVVVQF